jgi:hypothetical protein
MEKSLTLALGLVVVFGLTVSAQQRITESLDNWTLGTNAPEISSGQRGDGTTGNYIHLLVGTSPMYYEVMTEGEGMAEFWVYDPGNCLEDPDPGYGSNGPRWGLQSPLYQSVSIGVGRASYVAGCQGYSPWSTVAPYSFTWYKDGLRASHGTPYTAGWYQWSVNGTWDNVTFTIYDVDYDDCDGPGCYNLVHGDCAETYDATSFGGIWAALFGEGWKAFWLKGDTDSGIEDPNIDVVGGEGVFLGFGQPTLPVSQPYVEASWGGIKGLFR